MTWQGDVRDTDDVQAAMQGCERVVHLAYLQGTQTFYAEPRQVLDVALRGMLNVLTACEATGCTDLLLVSSSRGVSGRRGGADPGDGALLGA